MTAYAQLAPFAANSRHPRALVLIVAGHALVIAAVISARMDLPIPFVPTETQVTLIDAPSPPPENPPPPPKPAPQPSVVDQPVALVPLPQPPLRTLDTLPTPFPGPGPAIGSGAAVGGSHAAAEPVRTGPRFAAPPSQLRPPYPENKLTAGEEAVLRLRLSIDSGGRVSAVEPVGPADRSFLAAARRHILAHWRYEPATEDGRAVASSTVITLRFQLDR